MGDVEPIVMIVAQFGAMSSARIGRIRKEE